MKHAHEKGNGGTMGDYGWSMDSDTPQGIDAVEYGTNEKKPKSKQKPSPPQKNYVLDSQGPIFFLFCSYDINHTRPAAHLEDGSSYTYWSLRALCVSI